MRAKRVFEVFVEDSDPIEDLGIGPMSLIKQFMAYHYGKSFELFFDENEYIKTCADYRKIEFVKFLIDNKIYSDTSLYEAIFTCIRSSSQTKEQMEILKMLLNATNTAENLYTYNISKALLNAVVWRNIPAVKLLLKHGADPTIEWNGADLEYITDHPEIKKILKSAVKKWKNQRK